MICLFLSFSFFLITLCSCEWLFYTYKECAQTVTSHLSSFFFIFHSYSYINIVHVYFFYILWLLNINKYIYVYIYVCVYIHACLSLWLSWKKLWIKHKLFKEKKNIYRALNYISIISFPIVEYYYCIYTHSILMWIVCLVYLLLLKEM